MILIPGGQGSLRLIEPRSPDRAISFTVGFDSVVQLVEGFTGCRNGGSFSLNRLAECPVVVSLERGHSVLMRFREILTAALVELECLFERLIPVHEGHSCTTRSVRIELRRPGQ